ncbi:MAG: uracil-DNA glycosylase, partial [Elusimicrobiaceae bacterium]|nr:uracil-DNA glycosylase [Elusimicrobiaceae bacterium]
MKDSVRALAAEFKQFLSTREEDDLMPAAYTRAAAHVSAPQKADAPAQDHLTIEFVREKKKKAVSAATSAVVSATQNNAPAGAANAQEISLPISQPMPQEKSMSASEKQALLDEIAEEIKSCKRCPLCKTRLNAVPGEGNPNATLMFIGEGPGFDEDHQGRPFIGRAGQLLDKMIAAMGLKREDVFIGNIAKCHPMVNPENPEAHGNDRAPNAVEIAVCRKFIERQIAAISPKYIVALGGVAAKALISDTKSLGALRGKFHLLHLDSVELKAPVKILATYHPAALLRNPNWKKDAWADLQMVMAEMGLQRPQA